jgi:hypothetical protein
VNAEMTPNGTWNPNVLTPDEQRLLAKLQQLAAERKDEIDAETAELAKKVLHWSWDDPASVERAAYFMAHDPFIRREVEAINREFACADSDGLESL